ncbi:hypothetical protein JCM5296_007049 [Sporobolomyces johnsonii]
MLATRRSSVHSKHLPRFPFTSEDGVIHHDSCSDEDDEYHHLNPSAVGLGAVEKQQLQHHRTSNEQREHPDSSASQWPRDENTFDPDLLLPSRSRTHHSASLVPTHTADHFPGHSSSPSRKPGHSFSMTPQLAPHRQCDEARQQRSWARKHWDWLVLGIFLLIIIIFVVVTVTQVLKARASQGV